jgi:hypothetical protein
MEKLITVSLGGKDKILDVGKFWFTKYYGQVTASDPLNMTDILLKPEGQFDFVVALVYAGMRCHYKVNKIQEDFTKEDVENWLGEKESSEIAVIVEKYSELNKSTEPGE